MNDRHSSPPAEIDDVSARLKQRLDDHEAAERSIITVSDEQRLVVLRELLAFWYRDKSTHLDVALGRYQAQVKAHVELAAAAPTKAAE